MNIIQHLANFGNDILPGDPFGPGYTDASKFYNQHFAAPTQPAAPQVGSDTGTTQGPTYSGGTAASVARPSADDIAFLNDQAAQLRSLLGRTDTGLSQGLASNEDQYNKEVGTATNDYQGKVQDQNTAKLGAYDTINKNAGNGYRSLAQIIGRAAGTGSSAFQELLPDVVGKDTSSKRLDTTQTYGTNLSKLKGGFDSVLSDLLDQKKQNESSLRSGIESQRQNILGELSTNAGQVAQANGGGFAAVKAAQAPLQSQIDNSRNTVEDFFNQFRTPYTAKALAPDLANYTTDRSAVNAQADPTVDPTNPYSSILRKKLQGAI